MSHKKLFETFGNQFKSFGKELGFIEWFDNIQDYDAAIIMNGFVLPCEPI